MNLLPEYSATTLDRVHHCDALTLLNQLPDKSIDSTLIDPPYGTTANQWDKIISIQALWKQLKRVNKSGAVIVIFGSQPFTSQMIVENLKWFRYEWIWEKPQGTGYLNANRNPMKSHENIMVFYDFLKTYHPQLEEGIPYSATSGAVDGFVRDKTVGGYITENDGYRYPKTVLRFNGENGLHPTQKPEKLMEYLVQTHTNPDDVILDCFAGSGSALVAARNLGRHFIGCDISADYVRIARDRLALPFTLPMFAAPQTGA